MSNALRGAIWLLAATALSAQLNLNSYGKFEGELKVKLIDDGKIQLLEEYVYVDPSGTKWVAPKGMVSDGASIPQWAWSFVGGNLDGDYRNAAVIHDHGCVEKKEPWNRVHRTFYYAMLAKATPVWKAQVMYAAVYHFGPRWAVGNVMPEATAWTQEDFALLVDWIKKKQPASWSLAAVRPPRPGFPEDVAVLAREGNSLSEIEAWRPKKP